MQKQGVGRQKPDWNFEQKSATGNVIRAIKKEANNEINEPQKYVTRMRD